MGGSGVVGGFGGYLGEAVAEPYTGLGRSSGMSSMCTEAEGNSEVTSSTSWGPVPGGGVGPSGGQEIAPPKSERQRRCHTVAYTCSKLER